MPFIFKQSYSINYFFTCFIIITFFNKLQTLAKQPEMVPLLPLAWFERFVANLAVVILVFIFMKAFWASQGFVFTVGVKVV